MPLFRCTPPLSSEPLYLSEYFWAASPVEIIGGCSIVWILETSQCAGWESGRFSQHLLLSANHLYLS